MFNIRNMEINFSNSLTETLHKHLDFSGIEISQRAFDSIIKLSRDIFVPDFEKGTFKKAPRDLGNTYGGEGWINIMPADETTSHITDTLFVYCIGSDKLYDRLVDMIIAVSKHHFRNVIFFTAKWDVSALTGKNYQRLLDLIDLRQSGTNFCFILVSTCGISFIPVVEP